MGFDYSPQIDGVGVHPQQIPQKQPGYFFHCQTLGIHQFCPRCVPRDGKNFRCTGGALEQFPKSLNYQHSKKCFLRWNIFRDMFQLSSTRRYDWMLTGSLWQAKKSFRHHGFCEVKSPFKSWKEGGLIHKIIRYILHLKNPITWSVIIVFLSNHKNPIQENNIEYHDLTPYSFKSKNIVRFRSFRATSTFYPLGDWIVYTRR